MCVWGRGGAFVCIGLYTGSNRAHLVPRYEKQG